MAHAGFHGAHRRIASVHPEYGLGATYSRHRIFTRVRSERGAAVALGELWRYRTASGPIDPQASGRTAQSPDEAGVSGSDRNGHQSENSEVSRNRRSQRARESSGRALLTARGFHGSEH